MKCRRPNIIYRLTCTQVIIQRKYYILKLWHPSRSEHFVTKGMWRQKFDLLLGELSKSQKYQSGPLWLRLLRLPGRMHSSCMHGWCLSDFPAQGLPPWSSCCSTVLVEVCLPRPHVAEQDPHSPHSAQVQSTGNVTDKFINSQIFAILSNSLVLPGHGSWLQVFSLVKLPWQVPPFCAGLSTTLAEVCIPPPQVTGHGSHVPHAAKAQSTENGGIPLLNHPKGLL